MSVRFPINVMRYFLIFIVIFYLSGCSQGEPSVSLRIPVLPECKATVERAKAHYLKSSSDNAYQLNINIELFDSTHHHYDGPIGMATLVSVGKWSTLDGGSPIDYLQTTANGIFADCAPINSLSLKFDDHPEMSAKDLATIARGKGANSISLSQEGFTIIFNDGSYEYPF